MRPTSDLHIPDGPVELWSDEELERELTLATLSSRRHERFERLFRERLRRRHDRGAGPRLPEAHAAA